MSRRPLSPRPARLGALVCAAVLALSGCATSHLDEFNQIVMGNAQPADSPEAAEPAEGTVVDVGEGTVVGLSSLGGDTIAVQLAGPPRLLIGDVTADGRWTEERSVDLPDSAGLVATGFDGILAVPYDDGVVMITPDGSETTVSGLGSVTAALVAGPEVLLTGDAEGTVTARDHDGAASAEMPGLQSVDQLVWSGSEALALSRPDTTVSHVDVEGGELGPLLRAGKAIGLAAGDATGNAVATDATGDGIMVFRVSPLRMHQWFHVPATPWAVAAAADERMVWVTTTEDNRLLGYDLGSGLGDKRADVDTIGQPNSVAVTDSGTVVVGSGTGAGLHVVVPELAEPSWEPGSVDAN